VLVSFHPVVSAGVITLMSLPYPSLNKKATMSGCYCIIGHP